ncbi:MAG: UDP-N-acetylglucosamine 1-carboxyvinyltransferase [Bacilli bacterium]
MEKIIIDGNHTLTGTIKVSGAKNSAVALVPASLLADDKVTIDNIPNISDIEALNEILEYLGAKVERKEESMEIDPSTVENKAIPEGHAQKLRASYYFMGAMLGKYKKAEMYFPGGCSIGARPIDLHLKGFEELGAKIRNEGNKYIIEADELVGTNIYLDFASVGATINIMLAATKAKGTTIIENAAKEPEIVNVATFLNQMGAKITGAGTSEIKIKGVKKLHGCYTEVIPDRIEAGTYIIAGALVGDNLKIDNIIPDHIEALLLKLKEMKVNMKVGKDNIVISKTENLKKINVHTQVFPGFPTDLQQPLTTLLTQCNGVSILEENIYENRFQNVPFLNEMGANIKIDNKLLLISGPTKLIGKEVEATDLRAGACLVLAGLAATGQTKITNIKYILRGYEKIIEKLTNVGAHISLVDE